jgi:hypothetical protein
LPLPFSSLSQGAGLEVELTPAACNAVDSTVAMYSPFAAIAAASALVGEPTWNDVLSSSWWDCRRMAGQPALDASISLYARNQLSMAQACGYVSAPGQLCGMRAYTPVMPTDAEIKKAEKEKIISFLDDLYLELFHDADGATYVTYSKSENFDSNFIADRAGKRAKQHAKGCTSAGLYPAE